MTTANHALQGSWNCQLYLGKSPDNERPRKALALKWIETVLESGGMLDSRVDEASLATWDSPRAIKAVLAMKAAAEKMNAALLRAGRNPVPYALVLDGPHTPGQSSEAPFARRVRRTRLASVAPWVAAHGSGLAVTPVAGEILKPELPEEHLIATPCPFEEPSILYCSNASSRAFKPIPRPLGPLPGRAPTPVEVDFSIDWIAAPGTDERSREFQLVRRKPALTVPPSITMR
jgi:hypothetical protein